MTVSGRRTVLVVEDNLDNAELLAYLLEWLGFATDVAGNGVEALAALARQEYAAVLMDCELPRMDGFQATAELRILEPPGRRTPVLAVTAHATRDVRERCLAAGMDDCLTKPVGAEELRAALAALVPEPGGRRVAAADVDRPALAALADRIGPDALGAVLETFWRETEKRLARLRAAVAAGDAAEAARVAHAVKGAASSLAAERLAALAAQLQADADAGSVAGAGALLGELDAAFAAARAAGAEQLAVFRTGGDESVCDASRRRATVLPRPFRPRKGTHRR